MAFKEFKMLIEIGDPFPEKGKEYQFVINKTKGEFTAEVHFIEIVGWETKGKIGVYIKVSAVINKVTKSGLKLLKIAE